MMSARQSHCSSTFRFCARYRNSSVHMLLLSTIFLRLGDDRKQAAVSRKCHGAKDGAENEPEGKEVETLGKSGVRIGSTAIGRMGRAQDEGEKKTDEAVAKIDGDT